MKHNIIKILINESQFEYLLKEDRGVNRASIFYSNIILDKLTPYIDKIILNKTSESFELTIPLKELSSVWNSDLDGYEEFPIHEIRIDLNVKVLNKNQIDYKFSTGGAAEQIENETSEYSYITLPPKELPKKVKDLVDSTISAKFSFDIYIRKDFDLTDKEELIFDLRDSVLHETNHMLEFFKKHESSTGQINIALSYAGGKNYNIPKDIYEIWQEFLTMVYFSEPYEMRAMVQEMYSVRLRKSFDEFKEHRYYKAAGIMETFNADKMFDVLVDKIEKYNPDYLIPILTNLWKWFIKDYYMVLHAQGLTPNKRIEKSTHILDLMKTLQPRINSAGKKLKRKFNTLYSISPD